MLEDEGVVEDPQIAGGIARGHAFLFRHAIAAGDQADGGGGKRRRTETTHEAAARGFGDLAGDRSDDCRHRFISC